MNILLWHYLTFPVSRSIGYVYYLESLTSVLPNEALLSCFYFWWVHVTYISTFFCSLLLASFIVVRKGLPTHSVAIIILCVLLWVSEAGDLVTSNADLGLQSTLTTGVNLLLMNALNKYHPFIFYLSVVFLVGASLRLHSALFSSVVFSSVDSYNPSRHRLWDSVLLNLLALFMGSWWALQEGTWGGWWNWDSSETFGLIPLLFSLRLLHSKWLPLSLWRRSHSGFLFCLVFLGAYCILQLNFDLISHNFGARFFHFFNSNLWFVVISAVLLPTLPLAARQVHIASIRFQYQRRCPAPTATYPRLFTPLVLFGWIFYSFFDFIEASQLTALALVGATSRVAFVELNALILVALLLSFSPLRRSERPRSAGIFLYGTLSPLSLILETAARVTSLATSNALHRRLVLFTLTTILTNAGGIQAGILISDALPWVTSVGLKHQSTPLLVCDSWGVEVATSQVTSYGSTPSGWSRWDATNYEQLGHFFLTTSVDRTSGCLQVASPYGSWGILIEMCWVPSILLLALCLYLSLLRNRAALYGIL